MKIIPINYQDESLYGYEHWCPGCKRIHVIPVRGQSGEPKWSFNGNMDSPSFSPSVRIFVTRPNGGQETLCHYFITGGVIDYCPDSPHKYGGQKIPLVDCPETEEDERNLTMDLTKLANANPAAPAKPPETAPQAANPVPEGATETVDTPAEAREAIHEDHGTPNLAAAEIPAEEVAAEAMPADENQNPDDTLQVSQPADEPSLMNLRDPNAAPVMGESRPGTEGSAETQGNQEQVPEAPDEEPKVSYTSHPIDRFSMGSMFQFENGVLTLSQEESVKFDKIMEGMDFRTKALVKKIDVAAAEAFLARRAPQATKRIDSVDPLTAARTEVGTEDVLGNQTNQ